MHAKRSCPDPAKLAAFAHGRLPLEEIDGVAEHLDTCADCETLVEAAESQHDGLVKLLQAAVCRRQPHEYDHEAEQSQAIEAAREMGSPAEVGHRARRPGEDRLVDMQLGQYDLLDDVGQGGMGTVYRARHRLLGRIVAVKVLASHRTRDPRALARFMREMHAVGALDHPNVVRASDADHEDGTYYLVMDYVEGRDLGRVVEDLHVLRIEDACEVARQAAVGLQYIHQHGMVHRDIKPSNLVLDTSGQVKILDLGLSRLVEDAFGGHETLTAAGSLMGTYDYMSPEQCGSGHDISAQSDLYSLGCTLYELLAGRPPFGGAEYATAGLKIGGHLHAAPPGIETLRPDVPRALAAILARLLAKAPGERFATAAELARALEPLARGADLTGLHDGDRPAQEATKDSSAAAQDDTQERLSPHDAGADAERSSHDGDFARAHASPAVHPRRRIRSKKAVAALAVAALAGAVLAAVLLTIRTPQGTLLIEIDDPAVEAKVADGGLTITQTETGRTYEIEPGPTRLAAGHYSLVVRDDAGLEVDTPEFTLRRGEKTIVRVSLSRTSAPGTATNVRAIAGLPAALLDIRRESISIPAGEPLSSRALVTQPAAIKGVQSWTLESPSLRGLAGAMAMSPDSRMLAVVGYRSGTVHVWDADGGELIRVLVRPGRTVSMNCVAWSPDGRFMAIGGESDSVEIWEITSGVRVHACPSAPNVGSLAWSPNGRILALAHRKGVCLLDPASGKVVRRLARHETAWFECVAWSPDGKTLAWARNDGNVTLADADSGAPRHTFEADGGVQDVAWSPDGAVLAVITERRAYLLGGDTGTPLKTHSEPMPGGLSVAWLDAGKTLLCGGAPGCRLWLCDAQTGKCLKDAQLPGAWRTVQDVACSPDRTKWAAVGWLGAVWLWTPPAHPFEADPAASAQVLSDPDGGEGPIRLSGDGSVIARGGYCQDPVWLWNSSTGQLIRQVESDEIFCLSHDGARFVGRLRADRQKANILSTHSGETLGEISAQGRIDRLLWSPDGRIIAVGTDKGTQTVDAATAKLRATLQDAASGILAFSPDGKLLALAADRQIRLYDPEKGAAIRTLATEAGPLRSLSFSPDGKTLAGMLNRRVYLFDVAAGKLLDQRDVGGASNESSPLYWHDGGAKLQCGRYSYWDMETDKLVDAYLFDDGGVMPLASAEQDIVLHDGVATTSFWVSRLSDRRPLYTLVPLSRGRYARISPDGHVAGSPGVEDELVYVVQTDAGQLTLSAAEFAREYGWENDPARLTPAARE